MFKKILYSIALMVILVCFLMGISSPVLAAYPERDIKVIVHVSPGGGTDTMIRLVTRFMGEKLGVNFIVEDYSGAGGQIGYTTLAMAEPDGYTIGSITTMSIVTMELTRDGVDFNFKDDFSPIGRIQYDPSAAVVPIDSPFNSIDDLVAYAKENPGRVNIGGTLLWGTHHIHAALLEDVSGAKFSYIPFDGVSETRSAILGKHIDVGTSGSTEWQPQIEAGQVKCLAVAGNQRMEFLPDVPTYRELGYAFEVGSDRGLAAPNGTPEEYVEILSKTLKEVLEDPQFLIEAEKIGIKSTLGYLNGPEFKNHLSELQDNTKKILEAAN